jgi:hypothetical protein
VCSPRAGLGARPPLAGVCSPRAHGARRASRPASPWHPPPGNKTKNTNPFETRFQYEFDALIHFQCDSHQDRQNPIAFKTSTRHKMPSKVPDNGFQFGKLANNPCSTTLYDLGNGVHANGRQLANLIPSLVLSEYGLTDSDGDELVAGEPERVNRRL